MNVRDLEPKIIWNHFSDLNAVPRPSKKEERVIKFIQELGAKLGWILTQMLQAMSLSESQLLQVWKIDRL